MTRRALFIMCFLFGNACLSLYANNLDRVVVYAVGVLVIFALAKKD